MPPEVSQTASMIQMIPAFVQAVGSQSSEGGLPTKPGSQVHVKEPGGVFEQVAFWPQGFGLALHSIVKRKHVLERIEIG